MRAAARLPPLFLIGALAACSGSSGTPDGGSPAWSDAGTGFKAVFVYSGTATAPSEAVLHEEGRKEAVAALPGVEISYRENVTSASFGPVVDELVAAGNKIVFAASSSFPSAAEGAAAAHPGAQFEVFEGDQLASNLSNYQGRVWEAWYLAGLVAGTMTRSGKTGFVASFPIPEVVRKLNAFAIGVRQASPSATVQVEWVKTWYEPGLEAAAAQRLIDAGCDVVTQDAGSDASVQKAKAAGIQAIGHDRDVLAEAPAAVLTSTVWHLGAYYTERIKAARDARWASQSVGGVAGGIVGLGSYGEAVTQAAKDLVADRKQKLADGTLGVFWGPLKKQDGSEWLADGAKLSNEDIMSLRDLVDGVVGTLPAD